MTDVMRERGSVVSSLWGALQANDGDLDALPRLILRIIDEDMWRQRAIPQSGWALSREFTSFEEFVITPPMEGLGTSVQTLKDICRRDKVALDAIDRACQQSDQPGSRTDLDNNVNKVQRPEGNSVSYALRKLRKDRPDLLEKVFDGELTCNAAMVLAGYRKVLRSVRMDNPQSAARTLRNGMEPDVLAELIEELTTVRNNND